jgi:hypothetical protein
VFVRLTAKITYRAIAKGMLFFQAVGVEETYRNGCGSR